LNNSGLIESNDQYFGMAVDIDGDGDGSSMRNSGVIKGPVSVLGAGVSLVNLVDGEIESAPDRFAGVTVSGSDVFIKNNGSIINDGWGVSGGTGVEGATLRNFGQIEALTSGGPTGEGGFGVRFTGSDILVVNAGEITGWDVGVSLTGDGAHLRNSGEIGTSETGEDTFAVLLTGEDTFFRNYGVVNGDVVFERAAEFDENSGALSGNYNGIDGVVNGVITMSEGDDLAKGGAETDIIEGRGGADVLNGNGGADQLSGGAGDDMLTGGADADRFVFDLDNGDDVVTDFEAGLDTLDLRNLGPLDPADAGLAASETADGVLIDLAVLGASGTVLLEGVARSELDLGDVLFTTAEPQVALDMAPDGIECCWGDAPLS